jgi:anti-sigma B factor antagonist
MDIAAREKEGVTILDLRGRLTVGGDSTALRERITALVASGVQNVILNLEKVDYIDSTGLGTMVICFTTFRKAGGALKLVNLDKRAIELLVLTKLATVFEIFTDEQDAINSFFPNREIRRFDILSFVQSQQDD